MTEKIHSFKKEIDKINVPTEKLDEIILNTVQETSVKRPKKRKLLYSTSAAVLAFGLLLGSATVSPAMANVVSHIPLIGTVFTESGDRGLAQVSELGLTNVIGESQTVGDTTITIDEIFYGDTRFTIGFSLESKEPLGEFYLSAGPDFTVNGKGLSYAGSYGETEMSPTYRTGIVEIDAVDELPESFELGLSFYGEDGKEWAFDIPVELQTDAQFVEVNHQDKVEDMELMVTDVKLSPAGVVVSFRTVAEEHDLVDSYIDFKVIDENGNELGAHSGGSHGEIIDGKEYVSGNRLFDPIDSDVEKLTITPYVSYPTDGGGVSIDENGKETPIEFTPREGGDIEFNSFTVTLP